ncbi:hypothetical protein H6P81_017785 [Aristolochia fimbriata]|uniref:Uncharacterized protein n=1 Tax=Aristolochia fimbriata TaxID=158543 RepID=A0AAV7E287_ARIFI|nr:hypothetical protein H6P81_017785 [Aristolochia fimbriata]
MGRSPSSSSSVSWWRLIRWSKAYPGWKSQRTVRPVDASPAAVDAVEEEVKEEEAVVKTAEPRRVSCYQERVAAALTEHGGGGERGRKAKCRATRLSANEAQKPAETPKHATCRRSASFAPWKPAPPAYPDPRKPVRSVSFPAPGGKRKLHPGAAAGAGNSGDLDPVVGMSVLIVALVVLLLWGRLCAVFCTAAWFYFVPRLRKETRPPESRAGSGSSSPDKDSVEYKKKVVMEGLLERSHRSAAAIL